jgi:hypothetical protein
MIFFAALIIGANPPPYERNSKGTIMPLFETYFLSVDCPFLESGIVAGGGEESVEGRRSDSLVWLISTW